MKKTLTVNLGGTVYHIDEDAYRLLDEYLSNLKLHFRKQRDADEIVNDIEIRISELFTEKVNAGSQVIDITYVEEVIERMGKPEELAGEDESSNDSGSSSGSNSYTQWQGGGTRKRLFRNPDDKMIGGVISGLGAYFGWDVTTLRLIMLILLICGVGTLIPIYVACWLIIPEAFTAAEKLSMRGEEVTIGNIGKTVTDGFEKVATGVNDYMRSDKPRTFFQKLADAFVAIAGFFLKACLVVFAIICSPVLFVLGIVFISLVIAIIAVAIGGGAVLYQMLPAVDWALFSVSPITTIVCCIAGVLLVGIPLVGMIHAILRLVFNWQPMVSGLKWTLFLFWVVSLVVFIFCLAAMNWQLPYLGGIYI